MRYPVLEAVGHLHVQLMVIPQSLPLKGMSIPVEHRSTAV